MAGAAEEAAGGLGGGCLVRTSRGMDRRESLPTKGSALHEESGKMSKCLDHEAYVWMHRDAVNSRSPHLASPRALNSFAFSRAAGMLKTWKPAQGALCQHVAHR